MGVVYKAEDTKLKRTGMLIRGQGISIVLLALLTGVVPACQTQPGNKQNSGDLHWIDPGSVEPGPVRHPELSANQLERLRKIHRTLVEVDPSSFEKMVDDFKRDLDPEREILIWEQIASAYESYCSTTSLTLAEKRDVFRVLLIRSRAPEDEALKRLRLDVLTPAEARRVMRYYKWVPSPIEVERE